MKRDYPAHQKNRVFLTDFNKDSILRERIAKGNMYHESNEKSGTELMVFKDKDGLPVTYAASTREKNKYTTIDDLSVLWHEILSPLTVIKGYTGTLLELSDSITEEQKKQYLRGIELASNRMIHLLENLRDISHLESSDTWITHSVYFNDVLRRVVPEMQSQTNKHVIKINPVERLPLVRLEPEKIEQVLTNLLTNAIKYSPQGGEITVDTRLVRNEEELSEFSKDPPVISFPSLVVNITDDGIGVPEDDLEKIFQRFYRVDNQIIKSTPGAGLGLYICQMIVEGHGGRIWARNRLQGGSVFSFSLPLEQRTARTYKDYHK